MKGIGPARVRGPLGFLAYSRTVAASAAMCNGQVFVIVVQTRSLESHFLASHSSKLIVFELLPFWSVWMRMLSWENGQWGK